MTHHPRMGTAQRPWFPHGNHMKMGPCLVHVSFALTKLQNADSARRYRFRSPQQTRASVLDPTNGRIPKLDVAGSLWRPDGAPWFGKAIPITKSPALTQRLGRPFWTRENSSAGKIQWSRTRAPAAMLYGASPSDWRGRLWPPRAARALVLRRPFEFR